MKIQLLFKRYYTNKDVVRHRYGRLYELPHQLALLGHEVHVLCLDYAGSDPVPDFVEEHGAGRVAWSVLPKREFVGLFTGRVLRQLQVQRPDVLIASSDIPCLYLGQRLARQLGVPFVADLYDNYASFGQAQVPGFKHLLAKSVRVADGLWVVSEALKELVQAQYEPKGRLLVLENGTNADLFLKAEQAQARQQLGLPAVGRLLGTAGALTAMKGLDAVFAAWPALAEQCPDAFLVLAGRRSQDLPLPQGERVIYLGELPEAQVALLFQALDVGLIPAQDSAFGRYCFPQKLHEMLACALPVVGANVGAIAAALAPWPDLLYTAGDVPDLQRAVLYQLAHKERTSLKSQTWQDLAVQLEPELLALVAAGV